MTNKSPEDCASMAELRQEIDAIDVALIELLTLRSRYIDRAVDLKKIEGLPARTVDRVQEVITKVKTNALARGLDENLVETLWRELIEWSISREAKHLKS